MGSFTTCVGDFTFPYLRVVLSPTSCKVGPFGLARLAGTKKKKVVCLLKNSHSHLQRELEIVNWCSNWCSSIHYTKFQSGPISSDNVPIHSVFLIKDEDTMIIR